MDIRFAQSSAPLPSPDRIRIAGLPASFYDSGAAQASTQAELPAIQAVIRDSIKRSFGGLDYQA